MNNFNEQKFQTSQISSEKLQKAIDDLENLDFNIAYFNKFGSNKEELILYHKDTGLFLHFTTTDYKECERLNMLYLYAELAKSNLQSHIFSAGLTRWHNGYISKRWNLHNSDLSQIEYLIENGVFHTPWTEDKNIDLFVNFTEKQAGCKLPFNELCDYYQSITLDKISKMPVEAQQIVKPAIKQKKKKIVNLSKSVGF